MHPAFYSMLMGRRSDSPVLQLENAVIEKATVSPTVATASMSFFSTGSTSYAGDSSSLVTEWLLDGTGSAYEIRVIPSAGTFTSGTTGTWLSLGSTRSWSVSRNAQGLKTCTATVEIRDIATSGTDAYVSASVTLTAIMEA